MHTLIGNYKGNGPIRTICKNTMQGTSIDDLHKPKLVGIY